MSQALLPLSLHVDMLECTSCATIAPKMVLVFLLSMAASSALFPCDCSQLLSQPYCRCFVPTQLPDIHQAFSKDKKTRMGQLLWMSCSGNSSLALPKLCYKAV